MKEVKADLHIHTCLSPCAEPEMTPRSIVNTARIKGLDIIGICDHNSSDNVFAVRKAAEAQGLKVLAGIEICTREEAHILALFDNDKGLDMLQKIVYECLRGVNDEKIFGEQSILNEKDELTGKNDRLLIGATELPVERAVGFAQSLGALVIASHVDRESFSIISQLGFIPEGLNLDALEISPNISAEDFNERFDKKLLNETPLVFFSDAHCLRDIGKSTTTFLIEESTVVEIKKALCGIEKRQRRI